MCIHIHILFFFSSSLLSFLVCSSATWIVVLILAPSCTVAVSLRVGRGHICVPVLSLYEVEGGKWRMAFPGTSLFLALDRVLGVLSCVSAFRSTSLHSRRFIIPDHILFYPIFVGALLSIGNVQVNHDVGVYLSMYPCQFPFWRCNCGGPSHPPLPILRFSI